jgi:SAM-dependent methyltransferase
MPEVWTTLDLAEGFHLACAVAALHDGKLLQSLRRPHTAAALAQKHDFDPSMLRGVLQYVAARTNILLQKGDKFIVTEEYGTPARFILDQYIGAYGANAVNLASLLRDPSRSRGMVCGKKHAKAYIGLRFSSCRVVPAVIKQLGLNYLLDMGCGPGSLLLQLAKGSPEFVGWGLDLNSHMCAAARRRAKRAGLEAQLSFFEGDCADFIDAIPLSVRENIQTITAVNLLNDFFADGAARTIDWLKRLRMHFSECVLIVSDYYGCIGKTNPPWPRRTAVHDFVQIISGQGVPPPTMVQWENIYSEAGCTLIHVIQDKEASFFIHILRL